jgi:hypothetical protein
MLYVKVTSLFKLDEKINISNGKGKEKQTKSMIIKTRKQFNQHKKEIH